MAIQFLGNVINGFELVYTQCLCLALSSLLGFGDLGTMTVPAVPRPGLKTAMTHPSIVAQNMSCQYKPLYFYKPYAYRCVDVGKDIPFISGTF